MGLKGFASEVGKDPSLDLINFYLFSETIGLWRKLLLFKGAQAKRDHSDCFFYIYLNCLRHKQTRKSLFPIITFWRKVSKCCLVYRFTIVAVWDLAYDYVMPFGITVWVCLYSEVCLKMHTCDQCTVQHEAFFLSFVNNGSTQLTYLRLFALLMYYWHQIQAPGRNLLTPITSNPLTGVKWKEFTSPVYVIF